MDDTWMISSKAAHPNCMYMWMDYITSRPRCRPRSPTTSVRRRPTRRPAIDHRQDATHCDTFKATDAEAFAKSIAFWATPRKQCLDGSGSDCVPFSDWIKAWTEIKG